MKHNQSGRLGFKIADAAKIYKIKKKQPPLIGSLVAAMIFPLPETL